MPQNVKIAIPRKPAVYEVSISSGGISSAGEIFRKAGGDNAKRVAVISNNKVHRLYGERLEASLAQAGFETRVFIAGDGERFKSLKTATKIIEFLSVNGITRGDMVAALGGGVVGDLAGFAAAVHFRGVKYIHVPTTLLSMIDSSVGGKTGVNTSFGKNLVGSIYQPAGIVIDTDTLATLPLRELRAGLFECVKQGAIGGEALLERAANFVRRYASSSGKYELSAAGRDLEGLIRANVEFKARIVRGDESESIQNVSGTSRKILNFGHTFAHSLEKVTNYRLLKHGEAVGYGMLFAADLSKKLDLIDGNELRSFNDVVRSVGPIPALDGIDPQDAVASLEYDKKKIGDQIQWVLLNGIGKPVIVPAADIPRAHLLRTAKKIIDASRSQK